MWCNKCGNELPNNAKFCKVCGERCSEVEEKTTSEKENPFEKFTNKNFDEKTKKIMVIAIAIILVVVGFFVYSNTDYAKSRRFIKEGKKALAQENYEQAGYAFENAIAKDANNAIAGVLKVYNSHIEKKAVGDDYSDEEYADILKSYDEFFDWMNNDWEDEISDSLKSGDYYYLSNKEECQKQYLLSLGDMQMSKDKLPAARKYYDQVIEVDKREGEAYIRKANTYLSSADALSALDVIKEGLKWCVGAENLTTLKSMKEYILSNLESTLVKQYYSRERMDYSNVAEIAEEYHSSENSESYWIPEGDDFPDETVYEYYEDGTLKSTIRRYGAKSNMTTMTELYNESGKPVSSERVATSIGYDGNTFSSRFYDTWEYYENEQIKMYTAISPLFTDKEYYDEEGQLIQYESYNNESPENVYTLNYNYEEGKLKSITDSNGLGIYMNSLGFPVSIDESVYASKVKIIDGGFSDVDIDYGGSVLYYGNNGELTCVSNGSFTDTFAYDEKYRIVSRSRVSGDFSFSESMYNKAWPIREEDGLSVPSGALRNDDGTYKKYTGYSECTYNFVYDEYGRMSEMHVIENKRIITYTDSGSGRLDSKHITFVDGTNWYLPEGSYETTETVYKFTYESCEEEQAMTSALDLNGIGYNQVRTFLCPWLYEFEFNDFYKEAPSQFSRYLDTRGDAFGNSGAYAIDGNFVQTGYYKNDKYIELNNSVITDEKEYAYEEYNSAGLLEYAIDDMNREYKYVYSYQYNGGIYQK